MIFIIIEHIYAYRNVERTVKNISMALPERKDLMVKLNFSEAVRHTYDWSFSLTNVEHISKIFLTV